ncbi:C40 family peptidase [Corynebacterium tapiri]|uniref:NlpC/P60 family protein n=1 Tax=Corynebacterium tapiri TaxID=1448266 RepID=A0A5C4U570_9CORY|nr:C40 family peptidase [Corynebacterium tapiri]TNL99420.1 NlpC/P60 family protein [Corynebacterium tapiri]
MAKHRKNARTVATRRAVAATAAVAGVGVLAPAQASAAEVVVPNTDFRVDVQGVENIPGIADVPNIENFVPSLNQEAAAAPAITPVADTQQFALPSSSSSEGQAVVDAARSAIGSPYGWGSAGPSSFDCSGLTSWAYSQAGKSIPRTSQAQASAGQQVSLDALQPGDIIVYYSGASHVGIYTGNGTIIDSLNSGTTVSERPIDYMPIHSAVRF